MTGHLPTRRTGHLPTDLSRSCARVGRVAVVRQSTSQVAQVGGGRSEVGPVLGQLKPSRCSVRPVDSLADEPTLAHEATPGELLAIAHAILLTEKSIGLFSALTVDRSRSCEGRRSLAV